MSRQSVGIGILRTWSETEKNKKKALAAPTLLKLGKILGVEQIRQQSNVGQYKELIRNQRSIHWDPAYTELLKTLHKEASTSTPKHSALMLEGLAHCNQTIIANRFQWKHTELVIETSKAYVEQITGKKEGEFNMINLNFSSNSSSGSSSDSGSISNDSENSESSLTTSITSDSNSNTVNQNFQMNIKNTNINLPSTVSTNPIFVGSNHTISPRSRIKSMQSIRNQSHTHRNPQNSRSFMSQSGPRRSHIVNTMPSHRSVVRRRSSNQCHLISRRKMSKLSTNKTISVKELVSNKTIATASSATSDHTAKPDKQNSDHNDITPYHNSLPSSSSSSSRALPSQNTLTRSYQTTSPSISKLSNTSHYQISGVINVMQTRASSSSKTIQTVTKPNSKALTRPGPPILGSRSSTSQDKVLTDSASANVKKGNFKLRKHLNDKDLERSKKYNLSYYKQIQNDPKVIPKPRNKSGPPSIEARDLACAAFACSSLGFYSKALCDRSFRELINTDRHFKDSLLGGSDSEPKCEATPKERIRALYSCAILAHQVPTISLKWITKEFIEKIKNSALIAQLCWSLVALGYDRTPEKFPHVLVDHILKLDFDINQTPEQMFVPILHLVFKNRRFMEKHLEISKSSSSTALMSTNSMKFAAIQRFERRILNAIEEKNRRKSSLAMQSSELEQAVRIVLKTKYQEKPNVIARIQKEYGLFVDFCFHINGSDVLIEYDGPAHFCLYPGESRQLGKTLLKDRMLRELGYPVVQIPYWITNSIASAKNYHGDGFIADKMTLLRYVESELNKQRMEHQKYSAMSESLVQSQSESESITGLEEEQCQDTEKTSQKIRT